MLSLKKVGRYGNNCFQTLEGLLGGDLFCLELVGGRKL